MDPDAAPKNPTPRKKRPLHERAVIAVIGSFVLMTAFSALAYQTVFGPRWMQRHGPQLLQGVVMLAAGGAIVIASWRAIRIVRNWRDSDPAERALALGIVAIVWIIVVPIFLVMTYFVIRGESISDILMGRMGLG